MLPISPHGTPSSVLSVTWRFVNTRPDLDSTENRQVEQYVGTGQLPLEVRKSEAQRVPCQYRLLVGGSQLEQHGALHSEHWSGVAGAREAG